jgi:hypothetical protein
MAIPKTESTSFSFEQLLGWCGRFTPQFKFRLMSMRRELAADQFDQIVRETLEVFRNVLVEIGRTPKGPARARKVFAMLDEEIKNDPPTGISCQTGCAACCRTFPKQITDDEADLLANLVRSGEVPFDLDQLKDQSEPAPCPFLTSKNLCRIYAVRPGICRKYHVVTPASACDTEGVGVVPRIDLVPELIMSAALSLPDNGIGLMREQLAKRLLK